MLNINIVYSQIKVLNERNAPFRSALSLRPLSTQALKQLHVTFLIFSKRVTFHSI